MAAFILGVGNVFDSQVKVSLGYVLLIKLSVKVFVGTSGGVGDLQDDVSSTLK